MTTDIADPTCGFLPLHLYEGPELERAQSICAAINSLAMAGMGLGDGGAAAPKLLRDLSLRDMLDALDTVERYNDRPKISGVGYSVCMVPAERLIAAAYTLLHFFDKSASDQDGDDVPVQFAFSHWGEQRVHFLLVGNRPAADLADDEEEEADAA